VSGSQVTVKGFTFGGDGAPRSPGRGDKILVPFSQMQPQDPLFSRLMAEGDRGERLYELPIPPPVDLDDLATAHSASCILPQLGDAMSSAVEEQGHEFVPVRKFKADEEDEDGTSPQLKAEMAVERRNLRRFFRHASRPVSWNATTAQTRTDLEPMGWRALQVLRLPPEGWEKAGDDWQQQAEGTRNEDGTIKAPGWGAERDPLGPIVGVQHIEGNTLRYCESSDPLYVTDWLYEEDEDPEHTEEDDPGTPSYVPMPAWRRFRLIAHARTSSFASNIGREYAETTIPNIGEGVRYFRQFGDPRIIDCRDGKVIGNYLTGDFPDPTARDHKGDLLYPPECWANELIVDRYYHPLWEPYGRPWWFGVQETDQALTSAASANRHGIEDPTIPRVFLTSEGTNTSVGDFDRALETAEKNRGQDPSAHFRMMLVETQPHPSGDPMVDGGKQAKPALNVHQIQVLPDDGLFVDFDEQGRKKLRSARRLSSQSVGLSEDDSFASAQAALVMEDKSVVGPERDRWDALINVTLVASLRIKWWRYQTKARKLVSPEDRSKAVDAAERGGAMTPNLHRERLGETIGEEIDPIAESWGDAPFAVTLEETKALGQFGLAPEVEEDVEETPGGEEGAGAEKAAAPDDDDLVVALKGLRRYLEAREA